MNRRATLRIASVVLALALGACGGGSDDAAEPADEGTTPAATAPEGELTVAQAKEQGGTGLTVNGVVYVRLDEWMFCTGIDESSYPPGCRAPSLRIANPDALGGVKLVEGIGQGAGLQWTAGPISVTGDVEGDAITVTETAG